jgi:hypothetical protein
MALNKGCLFLKRFKIIFRKLKKSFCGYSYVRRISNNQNLLFCQGSPNFAQQRTFLHQSILKRLQNASF